MRRIPKHCCLAGTAISALILAGSTAFAQAPVAILGVVTDESGVPIPGATVYYNNSPKYERDSSGHARAIERHISSLTQTGKDGSFGIGGLPPSVYWLCASGNKPTHLRSCEWGGQSTTVDLRSLPVVGGVKLQVVNGVMLNFDVTDVRGQVKEFTQTPGKPASPGNFRVFAVQGTYFKTATLLSVSGIVRHYGLAVPKKAVVRPMLDTTLKVLDAGGVSLPARAAANAVAINGQPATVSFTVQ